MMCASLSLFTIFGLSNNLLHGINICIIQFDNPHDIYTFLLSHIAFISRSFIYFPNDYVIFFINFFLSLTYKLFLDYFYNNFKN